MDMLIDFMNGAIEFFNDLPDKSDSYWERIIIWLLIAYLEAKLYLLEIAYEIASALIAGVGISDAINAAWTNVPVTARAVLTYLKIPEAINMIISAVITRFVLSFMP